MKFRITTRSSVFMRYSKLIILTLVILILATTLFLLPKSAEPARALHFSPSLKSLSVQPKDPFFIQEKNIELKDESGKVLRLLNFQETVYLIAGEGDRSLILDHYGMTGYVPSDALGKKFTSNIPVKMEGAKYDAFKGKPLMFRSYVPVKGVYVPPFIVEEGIDKWLKNLDGTVLNALVIDYKDDMDYFLFDSQVAKEMVPEANIKRIKNPKEWMQNLKNKGYHLIARIVVFKSQHYASKFPDRSILGVDGKPIVHDGVFWGSPYDKMLWEYNARAAKEAFDYGFDEVQFDYVRFPDIKDDNVDYQQGDREVEKTATIQAFLMYVRGELMAYPNPISADVFGWTTTARDDVSIGQHWEAISNVVDVISPMIYPSHYGTGIYGLPNPNAQPYETVTGAIRDGLDRNSNLPTPAIIRPWIQDFSMGFKYTKKEIDAQIQALEENGIIEFLLWNAKGIYNFDVYKK